MNNSFCQIPINWSIDMNFWQQNGQLSIIPPFDKIYKIDGGGKVSSQMMTVVFFMCEIDDEKNKFARIPYEERKAMLLETYFPELDFEDPLLIKAMEEYPNVCMSAVARTLKTIKESLTRRAEFLRNIEYTEDNIAKIDTAISKNLKIYEDLEAIEQKFISQEKTGKIRGGRTQSHREKGIL